MRKGGGSKTDVVFYEWLFFTLLFVLKLQKCHVQKCTFENVDEKIKTQDFREQLLICRVYCISNHNVGKYR